VKDFDIILFKTYSILGRIIRYFINIEYNHAAIYYKGVLFESNAHGIDIRSFEGYKGDEWIVLTPKVPLSDGFKTIELDRMLLLSADSSYDFVNFFIWQPIYRLFGKWITKKNTKKSMICSEFVARVYEEFFENPEIITPSELLKSQYFIHEKN
jgi:hypothetical protein